MLQNLLNLFLYMVLQSVQQFPGAFQTFAAQALRQEENLIKINIEIIFTLFALFTPFPTIAVLHI